MVSHAVCGEDDVGRGAAASGGEEVGVGDVLGETVGVEASGSRGGEGSRGLQSNRRNALQRGASEISTLGLSIATAAQCCFTRELHYDGGGFRAPIQSGNAALRQHLRGATDTGRSCSISREGRHAMQRCDVGEERRAGV